MATDRNFTLFDEVEIFRPKHIGSAIRAGGSETVTAPEGATVQIRFDDRALNVWFTDEAANHHYSLTLKHPRISTFSETELVFEGFEEQAMGGVSPVPVTVFLSHSRLRTA